MSRPFDRFAAMETFVRIVEAGNLSSAAKHLGTSQPTISRRLQTLETGLGVRLLRRTTHAMQLTDAGQRYFDEARAVLDGWRRFERELRGGEEEPEGLLRVVAPNAFGQQLLVKPVVEYLKRYPRVSVEWRLFDGPLRMVEDGVDCVIRVGKIVDETMVVRKLFDVARVVVAAPSVVSGKAPGHPRALAKLPWAALRPFYRDTVKLEDEAGHTASFRIRPRFATDSVYALRNAVLDGVGVGIVSEWAVREDLKAKRLVRLVPGWSAASLPLTIAYPSARFHPAKLRVFVEAVTRALAKR